MKLTENFTLEELIATSTGIPNVPNTEQIENLSALTKNVLQPLRDKYGKAIKINSGFRSPEVNKKVKGAVTSAHCKGEAADLDCDDNNAIFNIIRQYLEFDQLIWEAGNDKQPDWVHVSYKKIGNRKQVLRMIKGKYQVM